MAINLSDYKKTKMPNIYIYNNQSNKFLFRKTINGKKVTKIIEFPIREKWTQREYMQEAFSTFTEWVKKQGVVKVSRIQPDIKVKQLWQFYVETKPASKSIKNLKSIFDNHISKEYIASLPISSVTLDHVQNFYNKIRNKNLVAKSYNRTIKEILRPMFKYAIMHRAIAYDPTFGIKLDKIEKKAKLVNCTNKLKRLYLAINEIYKEDPFYWTLFALIFTGRRKSEVLNLKWSNVDFENKTILLENTKNSNDYIVAIPEFIINKLKLIPKYNDLIFASPITGDIIINLDRQVNKIRKKSQIENFHLHMARDIVVGALAESKADIYTMSGTLLHEELTTLQHYLGINTYIATQKSSKMIQKIAKK